MKTPIGVIYLCNSEYIHTKHHNIMTVVIILFFFLSNVEWSFNDMLVVDFNRIVGIRICRHLITL